MGSGSKLTLGGFVWSDALDAEAELEDELEAAPGPEPELELSASDPSLITGNAPRSACAAASSAGCRYPSNQRLKHAS